MLRAHANTTADEFLAQLRTYVIALGLGTQVVDCVDNLMGIDELEDEHKAELRQAEDDSAVLMKNEIVEAVRKWACTSLDEDTMKELLEVIEDV
jgi:hypothetical protein